VDDAGYMPSKLYSYALSGKPLLGVLRRQSAARDAFVAQSGLGQLLSFDADGTHDDAGLDAAGSFFREVTARTTVDRRELLRNHLAAAMARRHADLFESCVALRSAIETAD
jgi:hypothetical protein